MNRTIAALQGLLLTLLLVQKVACQECGANGDCDKHERCSVWAEEGECYRSPSYMLKICPTSCGESMIEPPGGNECIDAHENCAAWAELNECDTSFSVLDYCLLSCGVGRCKSKTKSDDDDDDDDDDNYDNYDDNTGEETSNTTCTNNHEHCEGWAEMGECHDNPEFMLANCAKACDSCDNHMSRTTSGTRRETSATANDFLLRRTAKFGALQTADDHEYEQATLDTIQNMMEYFESKDYKSLPSNIKKNCKNDHELCSYWATIGECEKNMAFMKVGCAPVCQSCHLLDVANRCPELPDAVPALKEGDLNQIFERIVETAPGNRTTLTAKERRELVKLEMTEYTVTVHSRPNAVTNANANSISRDKKLDPWVIALDNFLTDEECDALIQHGYDAGYKRSEDVGALKFDGTYGSVQSTGRTSENAWCGVANECRGKTVPKRILNRMSSIMGIPTGNSEDFQILKYEVGQFYKTHHDYIGYQKNRQCGPRILTFFLYLSDVEAGGGTDFPDLGITVMPKKGRAVLWPSVYNAQPLYEDSRMMHQALPVVAGTKFGANVWVHMYDYLGPLAHGCD